MHHSTILVAIGANLPGPLGPPRDACEWALTRLAALPGLRLVSRSTWHVTAPVPASDQPDFINGAARLEGEADPETLLRHLHAIEGEAARIRSVRNAARTLDLDLLAVDDLVIDTPTLTLPHPRMHQRAFVLQPLAEIAPAWQHPVLQRTAAQMVNALGAAPHGGPASHAPWPGT